MQTLSIGTTRWRVEVYDKHAESRGAAAPGRLRFEYMARKDRLRSRWSVNHGGAINVLGDIGEQKVEALAKGAFDEAGFDRPIGCSLWDRLAERADLTEQVRVAVYGYAELTAHGCEPRLSRTTSANYRKILKTLDYGPGEEHLDWARGRLIPT